MKILLVFLLMFLCGCSTVRPVNSTMADISNSVGYILTATSAGSGVLIAPNKVLTASHICPYFEREILFIHRDRAFCVASVEYPVDNVDLAILTLEIPCVNGNIANISSEINDRIVVNLAFNNTCMRFFTNDIIGFCDYEDATANEMYYCRDFNTPLDDVPLFGNSGGAVFQYQDNQYQLIGIITATQLYSVPAYGRFVPLFPYYDSLTVQR